MKTVKVEGIGKIDFPDSMTEQQITDAIAFELMLREREKSSYGDVPQGPQLPQPPMGINPDDPSQFRNLVLQKIMNPLVNIPAPQSLERMGGQPAQLGQGVSDLMSGMTSPGNAALLAGGIGLPTAAQKLLGPAIGAYMGREGIKQYQGGNVPQAVLDMMMAGGAMYPTMKAVAKVPAVRQFPEMTAEFERTMSKLGGEEGFARFREEPRPEDVGFKDVVLEEKPKRYDRISAREIPQEDAPKYSSYQEPGGENYKEVFVTAPNKSGFETIKLPSDKYKLIVDEVDTGIYDSIDEVNFAIDQYKSGEMRKPWGQGWKDGHDLYSDIENPIVRLRWNERVDADGKKVLFLEEMQPPSKDQQAKMPPELRNRWREIGMRKAITYARENGFDKVAWTTGEMQAERYDVSKQLGRLSWTYKGENDRRVGIFEITGYDHQGNAVLNKGGITKDQLSNVVGKEMAQKMISSEQVANADKMPRVTAYDEYSGLDLKIGGEGLKKFYDFDLKNVAKKFGFEASSTNIDFGKGEIKGVHSITLK